MMIDWGRRKRACWRVRGLKRILGRRQEEGSALVEFALTLPLFIAVLMGTTSFSLGLYVMQQIGNAASAVTLSIGAQGRESSDPCAMIATQVTQMLPGLTAGNLTYSVTVTDASGDPTTYGPFSPPSSGTCTAAGDGSTATAPMAQNEPVQVTITYSYSWLPFLNYNGNGGWGLSGPTSNLTSTQTTITE